MPAITRTIPRAPTSPVLTYRARHLHSSGAFSRDSQFHRSDFQSQGAGYTSAYEPGRPTEGPLAHASKHGAPRLTPLVLKEHLDKFVVGQDRAKKVTSVAIFNHYQRIREIQRQEEEQREKREQQARWELRERERDSHPVENEFPGHVESVDLNASRTPPPDLQPDLNSLPPSLSTTPTTIEKSNLLLLGPSGVGKTYILSTLASILSVPFATVDCSSLTQAGYIGTDIESAIERLLLSANHSPSRCETGIIFFDEVDKLAKPAVMTHGRDVSGEGVQQGLLKMIEGTTVTVNTKSDRNSKTESSRGDRSERGGRDAAAGQGGKSEQYTIDTRNILFVFAGAFVGLDKIVASRLSSGSSLGFGAEIRTSPSSADTPSSISTPRSKRSQIPKNPLAGLQPQDLQSYGLIPELLGRIPLLVSLSPLSLTQLVSILTEPKNSLIKQYTALLNTYNIQLKFSTGALHAVAERALDSSSTGQQTSDKKNKGISGGGIGARGLRSILENVLGEIMFWGPGSGIRYCLVDEKFVREQSASSEDDEGAEITRDGHGKAIEARARMPRCWSRGQSRAFEDAFDAEEEAWNRLEEGGALKDNLANTTSGFEKMRRVGSSGM